MKWFSKGIWSVEKRMPRGSSENILEIESIDSCSRTQIQLLLVLKGTNAHLKRIAAFPVFMGGIQVKSTIGLSSPKL